MRFLGLLAVGVLTDDIEITKKWLKNYLGYGYILTSYVKEEQGITTKTEIILHSGGGLPIVLKQRINGIRVAGKLSNISSLGPLAFKLGANSLLPQYLEMKLNKLPLLTKIKKNPLDNNCFWFVDNYGNFFQVVETNHSFFSNSNVSGIFSVVIGVRDLDYATEFFSSLGYSDVIFSGQGFFEDLEPLFAAADRNYQVKRKILRLKQGQIYGLKDFLGVSQLDLVQILSPQHQQQTIDKYSLYFLVDQTYNRPRKFYYQYRVRDDSDFTYLITPWKLQDFMTVNLIDLQQIRIKQTFTIDLRYKYSNKTLPSKKLQMYILRLLDKI